MWVKSNFTIPAVAAISFCFICPTFPAAADILHVPGDYPTIQAGIDAAVNGDEVVVADGVYTGPGNRDIDFGGKLITVRSENGANNCIIDCQGDGRGFYFHSGETSAAVVEGFTVTNGYSFPDLPPGNGWGGGIFCQDSSPTITNCAIVGNTAVAGAGVSADLESRLTISDCVITANATLGGNGTGAGMYLLGGATITDCTVSGNSATGQTGGIFLFDPAGTSIISGCTISNNIGRGIKFTSAGTIADCVITGNVSLTLNGGAGIQATAEVTIENCLISGNDCTTGSGGGIRSSDPDATIANCTITNNSAKLGGGISGDGTIANCLIAGNSATDASGWLGGGGVLGSWGGWTIANCLIVGNTSAVDGGGVLSFGGDPTIVNCAIIGNSAVQDGGGVLAFRTTTLINSTISGNTAGSHGGGMAAKGWGLSHTVSNCVVWDNSAPSGAQLAALDYVDGPTYPSELTVAYSDVQGGAGGVHVDPLSTLIWGLGNIDADPLFVDPDSNDFHLAAGSPAIDAADNAAVPKDVTTDLDGNPRFVDDPATKDTGNGDPPIVDMGAYELQVVSPCPWDLDNTGDVGVKDLLFLLGTWGPCPKKGDCLADFDDSGDVGVKDLLFLLGNWGPCPK